MKTTLNYTLSEHVHSSKAARIAGFSSAMLRHAEIKVCNMFHLLYARNISPQRFDWGFFPEKVPGRFGTLMEVVILPQFY